MVQQLLDEFGVGIVGLHSEFVMPKVQMRDDVMDPAHPIPPNVVIMGGVEQPEYLHRILCRCRSEI